MAQNIWPACVPPASTTCLRPRTHRSELSTATMLSLAAEPGGGRSKKPAGYKTDVLPRDVHGNVKDIAPLDIQARVSRRPKPEAVAFARDSSAALLIWGDAHASLKPRPPPAARGAPPGSPYAHTGLEPRTSRAQIGLLLTRSGHGLDRAQGPQRPFCFMKHDRTEHRFLPDAAPSDWRGTNVYVHAPGGGSTRTASVLGAWGHVKSNPQRHRPIRPTPRPARPRSSSGRPRASASLGQTPDSARLGQPRPDSASLGQTHRPDSPVLPALLSTQAWGPLDSLPRNEALWDSSGSRATDSLRGGSEATLRNSYTAPGEGPGRAAGGGEGGTRRYSTPLGLLRSEGSAAGEGTGLVATPLTEGALQADASGYVLHRNVSQLSHIFGGTASHATEVLLCYSPHLLTTRRAVPHPHPRPRPRLHPQP